MTITNQTVQQLFNCDGSNQDFAIPFDFQDEDEVTVWLRDNTDPTAPTETQLNNPGEFTIVSGTTVNTVTAYSSDYQLAIRRVTVIEQATDYVSGDPFPADDHETALDKVTQVAQELNEGISQSLHVAITTDPSVDTELPLPVAYGYLRWNSTADQLQMTPFTVTAPLDFDEATHTWSMPVATASADGYLDSGDWTTFNSKQAAGNYITDLTGDVTASGPGSVAATIAAGAVNNAKVAAGAAIALSKLAAVTGSRALESTAGGVITVSAVTSTELGYVAGVTSAIQTQLSAKYESGDDPTFGDLTVTGFIASQRRDESSAATINDLSSAKAYVKLTATVSTINGIAGGADGKIVVIYNDTGGGVTINNASGSAAVGDRIITTDGSAITLADKSPQAFVYDAGQSRWVVWGGGGGGGAGDVVGPASSVDTTVAIFSGASGKILAEATGVTIAAGVVTATSFSGDLTGDVTGNADTATNSTNAANVGTTTKADNVEYYLALFDANSTANQAARVGPATYNPSTNTITATTFVGAVTGTASGNTTYTANQYGVVVSGVANAMVVIAPDADTTKILTSGGAAANPGWQYGLIPQQFGSYASPRTIVPATGITSGASHMSTTAREQMVFAQGTAGDDLVTAASPIENGTIIGQRMWVIGCNDDQPFTLQDGGNVSLRGNATFGAGCAMLLCWFGAAWYSLLRNF